MKVKFSYIRNRIREYSKDELLEYCYLYLGRNKNANFPIWFIFIIIKWTLMYGGKRYPAKKLTSEKFAKIYRHIQNLNDDHIVDFLHKKKVMKAFQIIYNQQFYLQKTVYKEIYATQLKLFSSIKGTHDIEKSFTDKTGLSILDFLFILQLFWLYSNISLSKWLYFDGFFPPDVVKLISQLTDGNKVQNFLRLLTLNPDNAKESISGFKNQIKNGDLQSMEISFFTMYPLISWKKKIKLVHKSVFNHTVNYFIYDFMKSQDDRFTTDLGGRFEKYIELGLKEIGSTYKTEKEIKKLLPPKSNLVDFWIADQNVFIECKAIEMQALPSVNPTDELIFNSLKSSIFKAYFEQLVTVSQAISPDSTNWGIIITYKELFWSHFPQLFEIGKNQYPSCDIQYLPPENVFIIDIYTWDKLIQIVKSKKVSLSDILAKARHLNEQDHTRKQLFGMQLDGYTVDRFDLSYLTDEISHLELKKEPSFIK